MSEYQYYEFLAVDRPLSDADRKALRALSTRARITTTSFTNSYNWGDFSGDPTKLMARWFDLHLYLANWGTRRLMIRLPKSLVDPAILERFLGEVECVETTHAGDNLILDIERSELDPDDWADEGDDCSGWLASLAELRADVLAGDLRLFYLLWLTEIEADALQPEEPEPMSGIGPLTPALEAFAEFFQLDADLVAAAAERTPHAIADEALSAQGARDVIASLADGRKTEMLTRLFDSDPLVRAELQALVRDSLQTASAASQLPARTVGELQSRALAIRQARERRNAEKAAAEQKRQARDAEKARRARLDKIAQRGESVWHEIETEIERRNANGYDKAASLIRDLHAIAVEHGSDTDFSRRLDAIRARHVKKGRFIERLAGLGAAARSKIMDPVANPIERDHR